MLDIGRVLNQNRLLRALTGLNLKAFDELVAAFSPPYEQIRQTQPRQRAVGGGRKARRIRCFCIIFHSTFLSSK